MTIDDDEVPTSRLQLDALVVVGGARCGTVTVRGDEARNAIAVVDYGWIMIWDDRSG